MRLVSNDIDNDSDRSDNSPGCTACRKQQQTEGMGKAFHTTELNSEMSGKVPSADLSVQHKGVKEPGDMVQTVSIFTNNENIDSLKAEARKQALKSLTPAHQLEPQISEMLVQNLNLGHEMSISLPNLLETDCRSKEVSSKLAEYSHGSSCTDICNSTDSDRTLISESEETVGTHMTNGNHSMGPKSNDQGLTSIKSCNVDAENRLTNHDHPIMNKQNETSKQTIMLNINPDNSNLSTVLENIPLVYIPHTKQLITVNNNEVLPSDEYEDGVGNVMPDSSTETIGYSDYTSQGFITDGTDDTISTMTCDSDLGDHLLDPAAQSPINHPHSRNGSLSRADASSFSSISSISTGTGTDFSASASISEDYLELKGALLDTEDGFMDINLHSRNSFEKSRNSASQDSGIDVSRGGAKPKRRGFGSFFTRGLFSRKPKQPQHSPGEHQSEEGDSAPGWKLFGRVPPKHTPTKDPQQISNEYQAKQRVLQYKTAEKTTRKDVEVSSTTALILENRPMHLPSKSPEEEQKHRLQYEAMIEGAKKKEIKEAKLRKKQQQQQIKHEEQLAAALKVWNSGILPNWESMKNSKKAQDLWWQGIPPSVRGRVWQLAIRNELNLTHELYDICVNRAKDRIRMMAAVGDTETEEPASSKEASVELIQLDVARTFPQLCIFQKGGPYFDLLHSLLGAYACYRPDVGYVQGMSFIAAVLLLNMDVADAFICFANLLNKPCQVAFFRVDESLMKSYFSTYEEYFQENLPELYNHFTKQNLTPDLYIIDWMFTLYSKSLPLDVASRVWDVFCRDGEEFLFRTALGILKMYQDVLLNLDFIHLAQFLTKLPENIAPHCLFKNIEAITMLKDKKRFTQVLASHRETKEV